MEHAPLAADREAVGPTNWQLLSAPLEQLTFFGVHTCAMRFLPNTRSWVRAAIVAAILVPVAVLTIASSARQWALQSDLVQQYVVYSTYLHQNHLLPLASPSELGDLDIRRELRIVIEDRTFGFWSSRGTFIGGLRHFLFVGFWQKRDSSVRAGTFYDFLLKSIVETRLEPRIQFPTVQFPVFLDLATRRETALEPEEFRRRFPNSFGYFVVSPVGFNSQRTEAYFYIEHFCGLCGGGRYVFMRKTPGTWEMVDEDWTWIS